MTGRVQQPGTGLCNKLSAFYDCFRKTSMNRSLRTHLSILLACLTITACAGPKVLSQTDDSITFAFPSGRHGIEDVKEDAELYCRKRGRNAELRGDKFCTAECVSCALQCRATFVCR